VIDRVRGVVEVEVGEEEMERRRRGWVDPGCRYGKGMLLKYARSVADASSGASTW